VPPHGMIVSVLPLHIADDCRDPARPMSLDEDYERAFGRAGLPRPPTSWSPQPAGMPWATIRGTGLEAIPLNKGHFVIDLDAIHAGLKRGEFFLEYLPTISLEDESCVGAETLVRWRRPSGIVPPKDFIPIAENTFLSGSITYWVIETAAAELGDWLRHNEDVHLSINVPPEIFGRGGLEYVVNKVGFLDQARKLVLEVTERTVPDKLGVDTIVEAANRYGVRIALDDVNVSGANLIVLSRCHVAIIKIDHVLVAELGRGGEEPAWLAGLSALMRSTPLEIIAEGVESAEQLDALRKAGIKLAQGYFFSHPLRAKAFLDFFDKRRRVSGKQVRSD
jgi:sensor c-di-GMP phosphodiesterase-like protein